MSRTSEEPSSGATVRFGRRGDAVVVAVSGEVDLSNAADLEEEIAEALEGTVDAIVDLSRVEYLDSRGLRLLNLVTGRVLDAGGRAFVVAPPGCVAAQLIQLAPLNDRVTVLEALEADTPAELAAPPPPKTG
jgi:anti-sigma B factor antagonist